MKKDNAGKSIIRNWERKLQRSMTKKRDKDIQSETKKREKWNTQW